MDALTEGRQAKTVEPDDEDEAAFIASLNLLTSKPVIYAANVSESDLADDGASNPHVAAVREFAAKEGSEVFVICAEIEAEISELDDYEKKMFLEDLGLEKSGLDKLISASYSLLGLIRHLVLMRQELGPSQRELRHHRLPERFTLILREASSAQRL